MQTTASGEVTGGFKINKVPGRSAVMAHGGNISAGCVVMENGWGDFQKHMETTVNTRDTIPFRVRYSLPNGVDPPKGNRGKNRNDPNDGREFPWPAEMDLPPGFENESIPSQPTNPHRNSGT